MKKRLACHFMLLLILTSMIIGLNGCDNKKSKAELTVKQVKEQFDSSFDLFQKCADILWNRLDYFAYLLDKTGYTHIRSTSAVDHQLYFSDDEWQYISELFEKYNLRQIKHDSYSTPFMNSYVSIMEFTFSVQPEEKHGNVYGLCHVRTFGSTDTFDIAEAIDLFVLCTEEYSMVNKLSYDNWYEWLSDPD
jgi:hypothetical protein